MFITFEGPDGSGKTTQIALLADFLREQGFSVLTTREPGGTVIGDQIRACLHDVQNTDMTAAAEILLYSASRAQLVQETIRPALADGRIVLCDRFADSTLAYQGYGRGLDLDDLIYITRFATGDLRPDLTFLLDLDVEAGLQRRETGGEEINRMDLQSASFYRRVRDGYHKMAEDEPERWIVLDADRPVDAIQCDIRDVVTERLNLRT
ncbi:MAG: dTMP kinase [Chloroflexota bacterium]